MFCSRSDSQGQGDRYGQVRVRVTVKGQIFVVQGSGPGQDIEQDQGWGPLPGQVQSGDQGHGQS